MGWKDIARIGRDWAEAKKTELLTTDNRTREDARAAQEDAERASQQEAATSVLEGMLPAAWAQRVTDARPENRAAREEAARAREDAERRERLQATAGAPVSLEVSGGEQGALVAELPVTGEERPAEEPYDDGPPPLAWLVVRVETPDPVPLGTTSLGELSVAVPGYAGPGRYDLVELMRRAEAGETESWEPFDLYLCPTSEADDRTWYADLSGDAGPAWVEVGDGVVTFDLPMQSAVNAVRVAGSARWA